jgi:cob(I)alamin adenosyltransferase
MQTLSEHPKNFTERTQQKNNQLEYAYQATPQQGRWVIWGSLVRAIGKGWHVSVISDDPKDHDLIRSFQEYLEKPSQITIRTSDQAETLDLSDTKLLTLLGLESATITRIRNLPQVLGQTHLMTVEQAPADSQDEYDLISHFAQHRMRRDGLTAFTGTGKGKTTTALGLATEALANGQKVAIIQWFKERKKEGDLTWAINEHQFPKKLQKPYLMEFLPTGLGFFGSPKMDRVTGDKAYQQHRDKAYQGLTLAREKIASGEYGLVVLDELIDTVREIAQNIDFPLIDLPDLLDFFRLATTQSQTQIVVTGRRVTDDWSKFIKDSFVISQVKHPWDTSGKGAVSGLDF